MFNRDKSRPSKEEEKKISIFFEQYDTKEFKIHDRYARIEKIKEIQKMINKLEPLTGSACYTTDEMGGGGIERIQVYYFPDGYTITIQSISAKGNHGIEMLTLYQLEHLQGALKAAIPKWKQEYKEGINENG